MLSNPFSPRQNIDSLPMFVLALWSLWRVLSVRNDTGSRNVPVRKIDSVRTPSQLYSCPLVPLFGVNRGSLREIAQGFRRSVWFSSPKRTVTTVERRPSDSAYCGFELHLLVPYHYKYMVVTYLRNASLTRFIRPVVEARIRHVNLTNPITDCSSLAP